MRGLISPRELGGQLKLFTKPYLEQLTHGLPSGLSADDKKMVRNKVAGGTMANVIQNQYALESFREVAARDTRYQQLKKANKFEGRKRMHNRTQEKRVEFNRRKLQIMERERADAESRMPKSYTSGGRTY